MGNSGLASARVGVAPAGKWSRSLSNPDRVAPYTRLPDSGAPQGLPGCGSPRDLAATADGSFSVGARQGADLAAARGGAGGGCELPANPGGAQRTFNPRPTSQPGFPPTDPPR